VSDGRWQNLPPQRGHAAVMSGLAVEDGKAQRARICDWNQLNVRLVL
jgi:hypothetical protein